MPADRTNSRDGARKRHDNSRAGPSTSTSTSTKKQLPLDKRDPQGIPGVSKLKASIRQTKRFLAKDTLEPGLRITTERRLVSLENDLATAQRREVEKKNGAKYHQVKFFEKRKLLRIIKRLKRTLTDEEGLEKKTKKKAERELGQARVMLNYVRHYPNTQKYIALFAHSDESEKEENDNEEEGRVLKLPKIFKNDDPTSERRQILERISGMMDRGELPTEPEAEVGDGEASGARVKNHLTVGAGAGGGGDEGKKHDGKKAKKEVKADEDDFFDVDDDE